MQYRKEEREEISLLKEEKRRLQQTIRQLTTQNQNLETNIQRVILSEIYFYKYEISLNFSFKMK